MTKCEYCGKEIDPRSDFVPLDDTRTTRVHVKCYLKKLFPDAKEGEIKVPEEKTKLEPCGCCSKLVEVAEDVNREDVYCTDCMGDPKAKSTKDRLGWAGRQFFEARFPIVRNALSKEAHKQKWDKMTYEKKVAFIGKMIEQGAMI